MPAESLVSVTYRASLRRAAWAACSFSMHFVFTRSPSLPVAMVQPGSATLSAEAREAPTKYWFATLPDRPVRRRQAGRHEASPGVRVSRGARHGNIGVDARPSLPALAARDSFAVSIVRVARRDVDLHGARRSKSRKLCVRPKPIAFSSHVALKISAAQF
jgi:hypothetical protein